jgi:hypothetical protein
MEILSNNNLTKESLLSYYREEGEEIFNRSKTTNKWNVEFKTIVALLEEEVSMNHSFSKKELLEHMLMIHYCSYVVSIEFRNKIRPYNYMDFARRIGEFYEPFCKLPFKYSLNLDVSLFTPPSFNPFIQGKRNRLSMLLNQPEISDSFKAEIQECLSPFLNLTLAEKLNLKMDLHFKQGETMYNVDIKSGFNCNEKGYATRLIKTAIALKEIDPNNKSVMMIRTDEAKNNNYLKVIKNSGHWEVYCGNEVYDKIEEHTHYPLKKWINENMHWEQDLDSETLEHLLKQDETASSYLNW